MKKISRRGLLATALLFPFMGLSSGTASAKRRIKLKEKPGKRPVVSYPNPYGHGAIVIDSTKRTLYYTLSTTQAVRYPVAVGKPSEQWYGSSYVSHKRKNPTWTPTRSMRRKNPRLPRVVASGPRNPLGIRAIYLGWTLYRIHGTNSPNSIGRAASSGCFRMFNEDVSDLYERVHIGAPVFVQK